MSAIETPRLRLRKAASSDLDAIWHNIWQEESIAQWMFWQPTLTRENALDRLERTIRFQSQHENMYFVCLKDTDEAIGFAGMREIRSGVFEESGICFAARYQCMGFGKEVLGALLDRAFNQLGAVSFQAAHMRGNEKSKAVITHFGFRYTHSTQETREWDGAQLTNDWYTLDRNGFDNFMQG